MSLFKLVSISYFLLVANCGSLFSPRNSQVTFSPAGSTLFGQLLLTDVILDIL